MSTTTTTTSAGAAAEAAAGAAGAAGAADTPTAAATTADAADTTTAGAAATTAGSFKETITLAREFINADPKDVQTRLGFLGQIRRGIEMAGDKPRLNVHTWRCERATCRLGVVAPHHPIRNHPEVAGDDFLLDAAAALRAYIHNNNNGFSGLVGAEIRVNDQVVTVLSVAHHKQQGGDSNTNVVLELPDDCSIIQRQTTGTVDQVAWGRRTTGGEPTFIIKTDNPPCWTNKLQVTLHTACTAGEHRLDRFDCIGRIMPHGGPAGTGKGAAAIPVHAAVANVLDTYARAAETDAQVPPHVLNRLAKSLREWCAHCDLNVILAVSNIVNPADVPGHCPRCHRLVPEGWPEDNGPRCTCENNEYAEVDAAYQDGKHCETCWADIPDNQGTLCCREDSDWRCRFVVCDSCVHKSTCTACDETLCCRHMSLGLDGRTSFENTGMCAGCVDRRYLAERKAGGAAVSDVS